MTAPFVAPAPRPGRPGWCCGSPSATAAALAVLVAVLATSGPAGQVKRRQPSDRQSRPRRSAAGRSSVGGTVRLSSFCGKWVLVNFAASWCVPCRQEMPQLLTFAGRTTPRPADADILTVAYDEGDVSSLASYLRAQPCHLAGGRRWPGGGGLRRAGSPGVLSGRPDRHGRGQVCRCQWSLPSSTPSSPSASGPGGP